LRRFGEYPQLIWFGNFGPKQKSGVRENEEHQAIEILCAAWFLKPKAHGSITAEDASALTPLFPIAGNVRLQM
jgi:hypothetical protein